MEPIDSDSYFTKNSEFAAWLKEAKGRFFRRAGVPHSAGPGWLTSCGNGAGGRCSMSVTAMLTAAASHPPLWISPLQRAVD